MSARLVQITILTLKVVMLNSTPDKLDISKTRRKAIQWFSLSFCALSIIRSLCATHLTRTSGLTIRLMCGRSRWQRVLRDIRLVAWSTCAYLMVEPLLMWAIAAFAPNATRCVCFWLFIYAWPQTLLFVFKYTVWSRMTVTDVSKITSNTRLLTYQIVAPIRTPTSTVTVTWLINYTLWPTSLSLARSLLSQTESSD